MAPTFVAPSALPIRTAHCASAHTQWRPRCRPARRPRLYASANSGSDVDEASVRALLLSPGKSEQQRGLLLVRKLSARTALELLQLSLSTSGNEFIRATAAINLGQLRLPVALRSGAVRVLIDLLYSDGDYSVRAGAAAALGHFDELNPGAHTEVVDALTRALFEDTEWQVQFSALAALGDVRDARAIPVVLPCLQSSNDLLVQAAVGALGQIGDTSTVPQLLDLLGCADMMTRQRLAQALGSIEACRSEPAVLDALRTLARDQSFAVRDAAQSALRRFGCADPVRKSELSENDLMQREVEQLLAGDESGDAVSTAGDALRRRLERSFDKEWVEDHSPSAIVAEVADSEEDAVVAPHMEEEELALVINDLRNGTEAQQTLAAIALRGCTPVRARQVVLTERTLDVAKYPVRVRSLCVRLLARAKDIPTILDTLRSDPEENVRSACCDAAAEAGGGAVAIRACVNSFETDEHWLVRISAAIALGSIGKGCAFTEGALMRSLAPGGVAGLTPPQASVVRRHAITALGFLGSTDCLPILRQLVNVEDTEQPVRLRIANALRAIPSKEGVEILKKLVEDEEKEVADMAQGSLDSLAQLGFV